MLNERGHKPILQVATENLHQITRRARWVRQRKLDVLTAVASRVRPSVGVRLLWLRDRRHDMSLRLVDALVHKGDVVLDVGANWGYFTYRFARLVGPQGHVHAFEPGPIAGRRLETIRRYFQNVSLYPIGLSDRAGDASLNVPVVGGYRVSGLASVVVTQERENRPHDELPVRLERMDALLPNDAPVAFIKCDVEGHEFAVLRGGEQTLRRSLPVLLVEIEQRHQNGDIHDTFNYLTGLGYSGYTIHANGLRPLADFDIQRDQLSLLGDDGSQTKMSPDYVSNFLFCSSSVDVSQWIERK